MKRFLILVVLVLGAVACGVPQVRQPPPDFSDTRGRAATEGGDLDRNIADPEAE